MRHRLELSHEFRMIGLSVILVGLSLATRFYRVNLPINLHPDSVDTLRTFLELQHQGFFHTILGFNWNGASAVNTYLIGWGWLLTQKAFWGVRLTSIILSALGVWLTFFYLQLITKKYWLSTLTTLLLISNPTFLHFSRSGWENIFNVIPVILMLTGFYYLKTMNKRQSKVSWLLLSTASILGFYFYHPGKLILPFILLAIALQRNINLEQKLKLSLSLLFTFSLAILPFFYFNYSHHTLDKISGRINNVSIFTQRHQRERVFFSQKLKQNLVGLSFFASKSMYVGLNERYAPLSFQDYLVPPVITLFYLLGLFVSLKLYPEISLFYLMNLAIIQLLSANTPNVARFIHLIPLVYILAALSLNWFIDFISSYQVVHQIKQRHRLLLKLMITSVITGILIFTYQSMQLYLRWSQTKRILNLREPAVWRQNYPLWLKFNENRVEQGKYTVNDYEWQRIKLSIKR